MERGRREAKKEKPQVVLFLLPTSTIPLPNNPSFTCMFIWLSWLSGRQNFFPLPFCLRQRCKEVEKCNLHYSNTSPGPTAMVGFLTDQTTNSWVLGADVQGRCFKKQQRGMCTRNSPSGSLLTSTAMFLSSLNLALLCGR